MSLLGSSVSCFPTVLGLCPSSTLAVHALKLDFPLNPLATPALCSPLERRSAGIICRVGFLVEVASPRWKSRRRIIAAFLPLSVASSHQGSRSVNPKPAMDASGGLSHQVQDVQP